MSYTIGILGGLGPEGTVHYYRKLTNQLASIPLEHGRPGIVIEHVWIDRFSGLLRSGADDEVGALLTASLERLHRAGANVAVIAAVTPHKFLTHLRQESPIPIVDIVAATQRDVSGAGYRTVGLLGTRATLTEPFFRGGLEHAGIRVVVPADDDITYLNDLIFGDLARGTKTSEMKEVLDRIVQSMRATAPLEALVVACTDLMDLLEPSIALVDPIDSHLRLALGHWRSAEPAATR
jgi:aspartate racemase